MAKNQINQPIFKCVTDPYRRTKATSLLTVLLLSAYSYATEEGLSPHPINRLPFTPLLANPFNRHIDIRSYWKSEKLDGIRAIWNGTQLVTRNGKLIKAPQWFIEPLPNYPLEGELWAGRNNFALVQQTVLDQQPNQQGWQGITFMLFDAPHQLGNYPARYQTLQNLIVTQPTPHIKLVEHTPIANFNQLENDLREVIQKGGEGMMLRNITTHYRGGRNSDLLKLKPYQDAEAELVGYLNGKGKYAGMVGAFLVRRVDGVTFAIGSGLSDALRSDPPEIGTIISYRYNGLTHLGKPRFARFLRVRTE
jgi:DNA ligase 1